jgi:hypothetical protein
MSESTLRRCLDSVRWGGSHPNVVVADRRDVSRALDCVAALRGLYDSLPRYSCRADAPDGCAVCVAREALASLDRLP